VESAITESAEINLINGRATLDTANANYSYGSLQRILDRGLKEVDLNKVHSILLLGVAGGSVVQTLRSELGYSGLITGLEIDPVMLEIAEREFGIGQDEKTKFICADAVSFVKYHDVLYDLIIVDLFIDHRIPGSVYDLAFWDDLCSCVSTSATIMFNTINETVEDAVSVVLHMQNSGWKLLRLKNIEGTNDVYLFTR
jgi:tRNA A58 N-methylase Trm61